MSEKAPDHIEICDEAHVADAFAAGGSQLSRRYANSTPPAVIVRVGTFLQWTVGLCDAVMSFSRRFTSVRRRPCPLLLSVLLQDVAHSGEGLHIHRFVNVSAVLG
jgi:hypothetical protein